MLNGDKPEQEATRAQRSAESGASREALEATVSETPEANEARQAAETSASSQAGQAPNAPKVVRRVVCSYKLGWLPGEWLQTWRRLDRVFARAELKVKATLAPLEDLPKDTDILVVPPELREAAREAVPPGTPI
ncbi:MAG: hypothetical protein E6I75_22600, partial [Chloroflexi bacterium]